MNNLKSYTEYAVTTPTTDFVIGFDFNYGTDAVNVTVDGVPATEAGYSVIYLNSTTMRLSPAVPTGVVRLQRETDIDVPDNQFTAGAKFIASNMDENFTQIRHAQQEVRDGFGKLSDDTYAIIDTLQDVGQAAQDAADAAEQAAQTANDAAAQVNDKVSYQDLDDAVEVAMEHVDSKLSRELVSVWDFFTESEAQAYNLAIINGTSSTYDSYRPLKEFFDYIAENNVGTAYCNGVFYTSQGLLLGGASGSLTKKVIGNLTLNTIVGSVIHTLLAIQAGQNFEWDGLIVTSGTGGLIYANRTVRRGLVIGGQYASTHTYIKAHQSLNGFIEYGFLMDNNTTGSCIDSLRGTRCGSGLFKAENSGARNWSLYSNFTVHSENLTSGYTQNTVLQVATLPPEGLVYMPMVEIGDGLYNVQSIDYVNSRLTLFPVLDRNNVATELKYYFGASVATAGSDASTTRLNKINASDNAIGYHSGALYPATVGTLTVEANGIDVIIGGNSISQAHVGGIIEAWHYESADYSLVRRTYAPLSFVVGSTNYEFALSKVYDITRPRNPTSNALTGGYGMQGITFAWGGEILKYENPRESGNNTAAIDVTDINRSEYWHYGNTKDFNIAAPNANLNRLFGFNRKQVVVVGSGNSGNPTSVTFNAPAGYTVNGQASVTFTGFTQAAKFDVYLQWVRNNFVVTCTTLPPITLPSTSVTYNPDPIAAGATQTTTVALTGVVVGDVVQAAFSRYNADIEISAQVSATNTVTVKFKNTGAAPIDLVSGILTVKKI